MVDPQHEIFVSLTRNAFDFLERGIEEFDKNPKYSVIHFCAAVEMLLKARLMKQDWSLIVSEPDRANLAKFMAGDFKSVTLEGAWARIRDKADKSIGEDAYRSFRALANHRNKMIHFFHKGLDSDEQAKEQIVAEHCRSWFHLHRLLKRWDGYFHDFGSEITHADYAMKRHRNYLTAKFEGLKPELDAARKTGGELKACSACSFEAAISDDLDDQIKSLCCLVCDHTETRVEVECPHCSNPIAISNEGNATCSHCGKAIKPENLLDALMDHDMASLGITDGDDSWSPANCGNCEGYHTVVRRGEQYFCVNCFDISDDIKQCQWCHEYNTGDLELSYSFGCGYCGGKLGWEKDD